MVHVLVTRKPQFYDLTSGLHLTSSLNSEVDFVVRWVGHTVSAKLYFGAENSRSVKQYPRINICSEAVLWQNRKIIQISQVINHCVKFSDTI